MAEITMLAVESPEKAEMDELCRILDEHNAPMGLKWDPQPLCFLVRDDAGRVVGGLQGSTDWGWLYVDILAVHREARGQDLGSRLLAAAEDEARRRGCANAFLNTFSFQALPFYEKNGYTVFGRLENYPAGHTRYYLQKKL